VITSATDESILATHDGAVTWQTLTTGSASTNFAYDLAINAANPMQLWAARLDGVWVSNDRGVTWNNVNSTPASAVVIDPDTSGIVYVGTSAGQVLRTANSGANWTDVTGNIGAGPVVSMAVNPAQNSQLMVGGSAGLAVSSTSGTTWSMQQSGIYSTNIAGLSADPSVDRIYIDVPAGGAFFEVAGAGTTQPVNNAALLGLVGGTVPSFNITAQLATAGHLYVSLESGLATSTDGGNTWSLEPIFPGGNNQIFALASPAGAPQSLLAATFSSLYQTTDAGGTWNEVGGGIPSGASVSRLLTAPSDPMVAYAYLNNVNTSAQLGIYSSADGGVSWSAASATMSASPPALLAVDPTAAKTLYGVTATALLKSTDGGATWTALPWNSSAAEGYPIALTVDPVHPQLLFASSVASIMRSPDGGKTWETLRASNVLPTWSSLQLLVDPLRPENLLVGTSNSGVQQLTVSPDLALTVVAPANPVAVGVKSTFTYTIANLGPFAATDVNVSLQLPASAVNVSATFAGGTCTTAAGSVTCMLPALSTGVSAALTLNATAPAAGSFAITGTVSGDQPDFNPKNNTASTTSTVSVLSDLSITTSAGTPTAQVGNAVSFTVTVNNAGPDAAPATVIAVQLPAGLSNGTATTSGGSCTTSASGLISCALGTLAVGSPVTITVNATAATAGSQSSTATVTSAATDSASDNNSSTLNIAVSAAPASGGSGGGGLSVAELLALASLLVLRVLRRKEADA